MKVTENTSNAFTNASYQSGSRSSAFQQVPRRPQGLTSSEPLNTAPLVNSVKRATQAALLEEMGAMSVGEFYNNCTGEEALLAKCSPHDCSAQEVLRKKISDVWNYQVSDGGEPLSLHEKIFFIGSFALNSKSWRPFIAELLRGYREEVGKENRLTFETSLLQVPSLDQTLKNEIVNQFSRQAKNSEAEFEQRAAAIRYLCVSKEEELLSFAKGLLEALFAEYQMQMNNLKGLLENGEKGPHAILLLADCGYAGFLDPEIVESHLEGLLSGSDTKNLRVLRALLAKKSIHPEWRDRFSQGLATRESSPVKEQPVERRLDFDQM